MATANERLASLLQARLEGRLRGVQLSTRGSSRDIPVNSVSMTTRPGDSVIGLRAVPVCPYAEDPRLSSLSAEVRGKRYHVPAGEIAAALVRELKRR